MNNIHEELMCGMKRLKVMLKYSDRFKSATASVRALEGRVQMMVHNIT